MHHEEQFYEIILNLDLVDQEEMSFEDISYLKFWWPLCLAEWNHLCNFGKGLYEENSVKLF